MNSATRYYTDIMIHGYCSLSAYVTASSTIIFGCAHFVLGSALQSFIVNGGSVLDKFAR